MGSIPGILDRPDLRQRRRQEADVLRQVVQEGPQTRNHVQRLRRVGIFRQLFLNLQDFFFRNQNRQRRKKSSFLNPRSKSLRQSPLKPKTPKTNKS